MYTGASCGTLIGPRNQYVAHGACSWESWVFTTLATPRHVPLVCCTTHPSGYEEAHGRLRLTETSPLALNPPPLALNPPPKALNPPPLSTGGGGGRAAAQAGGSDGGGGGGGGVGGATPESGACCGGHRPETGMRTSK
eukprot:1186043-Prorocentrum_minimum.AAC.4